MGKFDAREKVKEGANHFAYSFSEIDQLLEVYS